MSQYPLLLADDGVQTALNYLLSGPAGLGQNFSGYSTTNIAYLTGNVTSPFSTQVFTLSYTALEIDQITVSDVTNLVVGMLVSGDVFPDRTFISDISGTTITLSRNLFDRYSGTAYFTNPTYVQMVVPLKLSGDSAVMLDLYTYQFTFDTPPTTVPFQFGAPLIIAGVTVGGAVISGQYDQQYSPIGVTSCTTTTVTVKTPFKRSSLLPPGQNGTAQTVVSNHGKVSTDCIANAVILGSSDRVFLSGSLVYNTLMYTYGSTTPTQCWNITAINRYKLVLTPYGNLGTTSTIQYEFDQTIATINNRFIINSDYSRFNYDDIFTSYIDNPPPGAYEYRIDLSFNSSDFNYDVVQVQLGNRSLTAQVVKQ